MCSWSARQVAVRWVCVTAAQPGMAAAGRGPGQRAALGNVSREEPESSALCFRGVFEGQRDVGRCAARWLGGRCEGLLGPHEPGGVLALFRASAAREGALHARSLIRVHAGHLLGAGTMRGSLRSLVNSSRKANYRSAEHVLPRRHLAEPRTTIGGLCPRSPRAGVPWCRQVCQLTAPSGLLTCCRFSVYFYLCLVLFRNGLFVLSYSIAALFRRRESLALF